MKKFILAVVVCAASITVHAGKVDDIIAQAKSSCGKSIPKRQAVKLIKKIFLTCKPGQKIDIGGCSVRCLKSSGGAVVGGG